MRFKEYVSEHKHFINVLLEGGAMPGVGAIHISEIEPTLNQLEADLRKSLSPDEYNNYFQGSLISNALGSVGKKEFSGDIDISINIDRAQIDDFVSKLKQSPMVQDVAKSSVVMAGVQIPENARYIGDSHTDKPRTGMVQVDFMPGEREWMKTFYHSPNLLKKQSAYSGFYRNLMLATIAGVYKGKRSTAEVEDGRPKWLERFKYGFNGLTRVRRTPGINKKTGKLLKKNVDEVVGGPWMTKDDIVKQLNLGSAEALDSFESLLSAIKQNYSPEYVDTIIETIKNNNQVKEMGIPNEIQ